MIIFIYISLEILSLFLLSKIRMISKNTDIDIDIDKDKDN